MSVTFPLSETTESATRAYRAAVVSAFDQPLTVEQVAPAALEPGQIRVKVEASGLCHTDIHAAHGDWPVKPPPPFVPGHEGVGIVVELGAGVTEVALGDRVAMPWLGYACGTCDYCVSGRETLCLEQKNMGYSFDGAFGEYAIAYARYVVEVPEGIDPFDAAPLTCAGVTTYKAVKVAGHALVGPRRRLRRRRARASRDPVRRDRRRPRHRRRPPRRQARARARARRRVHDQRRQGGPGRGDPAPRRRRPGDRAGRLPEGLRAGLRLAAPRRHAGLRRAAGRQRGHAADLRDRAQRDHDRRLDRRHPLRPARGLRAARRGQDARHPRDPPARRPSTRRSRTSRPAGSPRGSSSSRSHAGSGAGGSFRPLLDALEHPPAHDEADRLDRLHDEPAGLIGSFTDDEGPREVVRRWRVAHRHAASQDKRPSWFHERHDHAGSTPRSPRRSS